MGVKDVDATVLLQIVRLGLSVITDRLLTMCTLWMTFGLTCWAMYMPSIERLYVAAGFALVVYLPSLVKERPRERQIKQEHD